MKTGDKTKRYALDNARLAIVPYLDALPKLPLILAPDPPVLRAPGFQTPSRGRLMRPLFVMPELGAHPDRRKFAYLTDLNLITMIKFKSNFKMERLLQPIRKIAVKGSVDGVAGSGKRKFR